MQELLSFTSDLKKNNNREWFNKHKYRYEASKKMFLAALQEIIDHLQLKDPRLANLESKDTIFRIYRDVRFSKDKSPYKTNFAAYMARGGRKSREAGYYIHLSDNEIFLGAGVHSPDKDDLLAIRQEILYQPEAYIKMVNSIEKMGFSHYEKDKLKTAPKGFEKDSPYIDLIRYRHYLMSATLDKEEVLGSNFSKIAAKKFEALIPFTNFLNASMEFKGNE